MSACPASSDFTKFTSRSQAFHHEGLLRWCVMKPTLFRTTVTLSFFMLALHASSASAALIQIGAADTGAYQSNGAHVATLQNYITGQFQTESRSFFVFDLTGVSAPITAAT